MDDTATVVEDAAATKIDVLSNDTDVDGGPISIASVTQPTNGAVLITNAGADLTYQPDSDYCNDGTPTDDFTYTLTPGGSVGTVRVTVTCEDDAPVAVDDTKTVAEDASATMIDVLSNDTDIDGGTKEVASITQPANGTVTNNTTSVSYAPDSDYCNDGTPTDDFTYTLNGGSTATVEVTVTCVDDPPVAVDDSATVDENSGANTVNVLSNDTDIDGGPISVASVTQPANGTVVNNTTNVSYAPDADYCNDGTPTDNFTYTLSPGGSSATVSMSVTCLPDPPIAVNDIYAAVGNVRIQVPDGADDVLERGTDDTLNGGAITTFGPTTGAETAVGVAGASVNGGAVTLNANGSFSYNPPAGYEGADTFKYTLANAGGSSVGTVTINVSGMIWFVDATAAGGGDGRLTAPYNCLTGAGCFDPAASDGAGDNIFLADGAYTGGLTLLNNQRLIGDGSSSTLAAITGLILPSFSDALPVFSGTDPVITSAANGVNLGSGNTVRGLTIGNTTGTGLIGTSVGTATVAETTVNGTGPGVNINTGVLAISFDALSSSNAAGIALSGVTGDFDVTTGTISSGSATAVSIASGSTVDLGVTLVSVSSNGAATGISLTNTTGSFTVTGDGTTATQGGNDSGGVIQNASADGVVLNNAAGVTLRNMTIGDPTASPANSPDGTNNIVGDGIDADNLSNLSLYNVTIARTGIHAVTANNVTNFRLEDSLILNPGDGNEEHGLDFTELRGDNFVIDSLFDAFNETGIELSNASGAVDLTITGSTFQDNAATVGNHGEEAILLDATGTAQMNVLIGGSTPADGNTFDDLALEAIHATPVGTSSVHLTVTNNAFVEGNAGDGVVIFIPDGMSGTSRSNSVTVNDNTFNDDPADALPGPFAVLLKNDSQGRMDAIVQGNTINDHAGVSLNHDSAGSAGAANGESYVLIGGPTLATDANVITDPSGVAIDVVVTEDPATGTDPDVHLTVENNTAGAPVGLSTFSSGIRIQTFDFGRMNLDIVGNTATGDPGIGAPGITLDQFDSSVFRIDGLIGSGAAAATTYVNANNTSTIAGVATGNFSAGTVVLPPATLLPSP